MRPQVPIVDGCRCLDRHSRAAFDLPPSLSFTKDQSPALSEGRTMKRLSPATEMRLQRRRPGRRACRPATFAFVTEKRLRLVQDPTHG